MQISHIDGARQMVHVCHGKGGKVRYVPLPQPVLEDAAPILGHSPRSSLALSSTHQTVNCPGMATGAAGFAPASSLFLADLHLACASV